MRFPVALAVGVGSVLAVNLVARQIAAPLSQLCFYLASLGALSLIPALRGALPQAQALLLVAAGLLVGARHAGALSSGALRWDDALGESIDLGTGLGRGVGIELRAALARLGEDPHPELVRYAAKVDARASDINILASHLADGCDGADHVCETIRILRFVTDEVVYREDPRGGGDYIKSPEETLAANAGDCEDKTILLASLLESLGNRTWLAFSPDHVRPLVCFAEPLPELWRRRRAGRSPEWRARDAARLSPTGDADELDRLVEQAAELEIDDRACYALESTARGSFLGVADGLAYDLAIESLPSRSGAPRRVIDFRRAPAAPTSPEAPPR